MILATTDTLRDREIVRTVGLVRGNSVRARHLGKDVLAWMRNIVGGEVHEYVKLTAEAREQALDRMVEEAERLGANAVLAVRFSTSSVMGAAAEMVAYGTAVIVKERD
ncbi:MAG TPA: YbjQ family protein [Acidobacteriota bacterium]|nr:YbjQ family protein [Acidobacteriota bacterium]